MLHASIQAMHNVQRRHCHGKTNLVLQSFSATYNNEELVSTHLNYRTDLLYFSG
jgi:hypothetical protein